MAQGISKDEICELESEVGFSLPEAYRSFLQTYGVSGVMVGTDYEYSKLADVRSWSDDLIRESGLPKDLFSDMFVFAIHQGYQIYFFKRGSGEDPLVYSYTEGDASIRSTDLTFSKFVEAYQKAEGT